MIVQHAYVNRYVSCYSLSAWLIGPYTQCSCVAHALTHMWYPISSVLYTCVYISNSSLEYQRVDPTSIYTPHMPPSLYSQVPVWSPALYTHVYHAVRSLVESWVTYKLHIHTWSHIHNLLKQITDTMHIYYYRLNILWLLLLYYYINILLYISKLIFVRVPV